VNFEEYLSSKKINSAAFLAAEKSLWESWKTEFDAISPVAFTAQKLFLINPIRRKYQAKLMEKPISPVSVSQSDNDPKDQKNEGVSSDPKPAIIKPMVPRPVFKPKPKTTE